jgi:hypothetical protein
MVKSGRFSTDLVSSFELSGATSEIQAGLMRKAARVCFQNMSFP